MDQPSVISAQDLDDILEGTTVLGSGGGGSYASGKSLVAFINGQTRRPTLADPLSGVGDADTMAIPAFVGAITTIPTDVQKDALLAFTGLNKMTQGGSGSGFSFVLPGETGSANVLIPLAISATQGLPVVDAAGARRSIPSLTQCTWASNALPIAPIVLANGGQQVSFDAPSAAAAEPIMRAIISSSGFADGGGIAFWPMNGKMMKAAAVPHCVSYARGLGQALRLAREGGDDPVEAVRGYLGGHVLFTGQIVQSVDQAAGGFDVGTVVLRNAAGEELWIYNQNENLIAWSSGRSQPLAMAPDLICYLTTDGQAFTNGDLSPAGGESPAHGKEVAIIVAPSMPVMREKFIVDAFLAAFKKLGYAGPYVPLEELLQAAQR